MKYVLKITSIFFLITLLSIGCQKTQLLGEYYLGNLKYENPYIGNESLVFNTSNNYSLTFNCQERNSIINETKPSVNSNDYYLWEEDYTIFTELNGDYDLSIIMSVTESSPAGMAIRIHDYITDTNGYIGARADFFLPMSIENLLEGQVFYDSLDILGKTYYDVYMDSVVQYREFQQPPLPVDTNHIMPTTLFYNTSHGILKLDFTDGSWWGLSEIN